MAPKSLKSFVKESSIKKEVQTWSIDDCLAYIKKHEKDPSKNKLLETKLDIVRARIAELTKQKQQFKRSIEKEVQAWSINACSNYIEEHQKDPIRSELLEIKLDIVRARIAELAKDLDANNRRKTFKTWPYEDIVKYLSNSVPRRCRDDYHREWKPGIHPNIGIYLWAKGYDVTRPLGAGGFGCVWECDGKAVKVIRSERAAEMELLSAEQMAALINKDTSGKCKKYFNYLVSQDEDSSILEAILANMDLSDAAKEKVTSGRTETKKATKTIDSLLRQLRQATKALIKLHELGYSHNDVKPENFLKIDKERLGLANKTSKDGKEHKHRIQLADFGTMTKIPENGEVVNEESRHLSAYSPRYAPDTMGRESTREEIEKRDVYALGVSGLELLLKKIPTGESFKHKETFKTSNDNIYSDFNLEEYYGGTSKENMFEFLELLRKMANENYTARPTLEKTLKLLKQINPGK